MPDCTDSELNEAQQARKELTENHGTHKLNRRERRLLVECFGRGDVFQLLRKVLQGKRECVVEKYLELKDLYIQGVVKVITAEVFNSCNPMRDEDVRRARSRFLETERQLKACVEELKDKSRGFNEAHRDVINPSMTDIANWQQLLEVAQWNLQGFQVPPEEDIEEYQRYQKLKRRLQGVKQRIELIRDNVNGVNSLLIGQRARVRGTNGDERRKAQSNVELLKQTRRELRVSLGESQRERDEIQAELRELDPDRKTSAREAQIKRRWRRVKQYLKQRRHPNFEARAYQAWIKAQNSLKRWYEWLPRQEPLTGQPIDQLFNRRIDPYTRRNYPIFTGGVWDRQRLWELYLLTLERLAEGTGYFVINRIVSAISGLYGPVNRGLNLGVKVTSNASSYPGHGYFAIDVGRRAGVPMQIVIPEEITLPSRFGSGSYQHVKSETVPSSTRAVSAHQNIFGALNYGMGWTRSADIRRRVKRARRAEKEGRNGAVVRIERAEDAVGEAIEDESLPADPRNSDLVIPMRPPEFGKSPRASRILFGLAQHGAIGGSEIDPEIRAVSRKLLKDLADRIEREKGIDRPFSEAALEGSRPVQSINDVFREGVPRREIEKFVRKLIQREQPSSNPMTSDDFADQIWKVNWMLLQKDDVEPHRKGNSATIEHEYKKVDGDGPNRIRVRIFVTHMRQVEGRLQSAQPVRVSHGDPLGQVGSSGNAVTPHVHIEITVRLPDVREPLGGLWLHEFFEPPPLPLPPD